MSNNINIINNNELKQGVLQNPEGKNTGVSSFIVSQNPSISTKKNNRVSKKFALSSVVKQFILSPTIQEYNELFSKYLTQAPVIYPL